LALLVAAARVAAGVHYVHDVTSGLVLGIAVTLAGALLLHPTLQRSRSALSASRSLSG
jgi:undecaprenyl-diphosphatase